MELHSAIVKGPIFACHRNKLYPGCLLAFSFFTERTTEQKIERVLLRLSFKAACFFFSPSAQQDVLYRQIKIASSFPVPFPDPGDPLLLLTSIDVFPDPGYDCIVSSLVREEGRSCSRSMDDRLGFPKMSVDLELGISVLMMSGLLYDTGISVRL